MNDKTVEIHTPVT